MDYTNLSWIRTFQFLTNFTVISLVFLMVKLHLCNAPLWKGEKICNFWDTKIFKLEKILVTKLLFRFWSFFLHHTLWFQHCIYHGTLVKKAFEQFVTVCTRSVRTFKRVHHCFMCGCKSLIWESVVHSFSNGRHPFIFVF